MNDQSLSLFEDAALDDTLLATVSGGFGSRRGGRRFDIDIDIDVDISIVNIRGNGNVVSGRDANIFGRR